MGEVDKCEIWSNHHALPDSQELKDHMHECFKDKESKEEEDNQSKVG